MTTTVPSAQLFDLASVGVIVPDRVVEPAEDIIGRVISAGQPRQVVELNSRLTGNARVRGYASTDKSVVAISKQLSRASVSHQRHSGGDHMATIQPDSGIQLLIIIGAMFVFASVRPELGMMLLTLGVGAWALYNIANLSRQF